MQFLKVPIELISHLEDLSPNALKLYLLLLSRRNRQTGLCCPSWENLGWEKTRYYRARKELEIAKLISFEGLEATFSTVAELEKVQLKDSCRVGESATPELQKVQLAVAESATPELQKVQLAYKEQPEETNQRNSNQRNSNQKILTASATLQPQLTASKRVDPEYEKFAAIHLEIKHVPYVNKTADFIQLANLRKKLTAQDWELSAERWETAVRNYFASEIGSHTLADLATRFTTFAVTSLDRFGKPTLTAAAQANPQLANLSPQSQANYAAMQRWLSKGENQ